MDRGGLVEAAPPVALREIFRRFWPDARPYRGWLALGLLLVALVPVVDAAAVWIFKHVVDDVLVPRDFGAFLPLAAAFVGVHLAGAAIGFADDYLSDWVGERFLLGMRTRLFGHLQALSMDTFERRRLGDLLTRLTGDVAAIESFVLTGVADLVSYVVRILVFATALVVLSWKLSLVAAVIAPLFWFAARFFSLRIKAASREKRRRSGALGAVAEESLGNAALVQAYNRQEEEAARYGREAEGAFRARAGARGRRDRAVLRAGAGRRRRGGSARRRLGDRRHAVRRSDRAAPVCRAGAGRALRAAHADRAACRHAAAPAARAARRDRRRARALTGRPAGRPRADRAAGGGAARRAAPARDGERSAGQRVAARELRRRVARVVAILVGGVRLRTRRRRGRRGRRAGRRRR